MEDEVRAESLWAEDLPSACPPKEAWNPAGDQFYRLVANFPPQAEDFYSFKKLYPGKRVNNECIARAVSICNTLEDCAEIRKLPTLKDKTIVVEIDLPPESGVVLQTGFHRSHFSWWRYAAFNPIPYCQQITV